MSFTLIDLLKFICRQGYAVSPMGKDDYSSGKDLNLKSAAVKAGIGRWGKNSLVLHPVFGPWLRFAAVAVEAELLSLPEQGLIIIKRASSAMAVMPAFRLA